MQYQTFFRSLSLLAIVILCGVNAHADRIELPELGTSSSVIISVEQERQLGQAWLRSFRRQSDLSEDYITQEYIENLLFSMVPNAGLADNRLDVLVVQNPTLNAFAVPGGIVGVHTGLMLHAQTEDQLSSVLAHELVHLSQRHFARSVAAQKGNTITSMAGLLAGVILAATAGGEAGLAVLSATQAATLQSQLKYSRQNEQEADRLGMEVLIQSGRDPAAMKGMFEQMLKTTRFTGFQVPEYLRTHPLTENRVNDAGNRARRYDQQDYYVNPDYRIIQTRVRVAGASSPQFAVREFSAAFKESKSMADQYGLALAHHRAFNIDDALIESYDLHKKHPDNQFVTLLYADILGDAGRANESEKMLKSELQYKPKSYALNMALAEAYTHQSKFEDAAEIYRTQTKLRPNDALVWYEYAETLGLAGDILELHKARAQYFIHVGAFQRAIRQLQYAKREVEGNPIELAILDRKISEAAQLQSEASF